jgi:hypothetical protein
MEKSNDYYKRKIKQQGRTQKWVAQKIGMSPELLSMKLNEKVTLTKYEKQMLDKILGL